MRILHAVTVPVTVHAFLRGQLADLADAGHEVHLVCSPGVTGVDPRVKVHEVSMARDPSPLPDLRALLSLIRLLRAVRPDVTVVGTPKAGLLVGLAALLARVPRRFYLLRGLRLESANGLQRAVLTALEVLACRAARTVVAVSPSLAQEVLRLPGVPRGRVTVAGAGSSNGVDTTRYAPAEAAVRATQRALLSIGPDEVVVGFVGRLGPDKGLPELLDAWETLGPAVRPVVVGALEAAGPDAQARLDALGAHVTGFVTDTVPWWAALDMLVLPTHREGFPNVVLEAGACGLPTVTTTATGARDSVVDGVTGLLVPVRDAAALSAALSLLAEDAELRHGLGMAARERVLAEFDQPTVWARYRELWTSSG